jgi:hypothetical protein
MTSGAWSWRGWVRSVVLLLVPCLVALSACRFGTDEDATQEGRLGDPLEADGLQITLREGTAIDTYAAEIANDGDTTLSWVSLSDFDLEYETGETQALQFQPLTGLSPGGRGSFVVHSFLGRSSQARPRAVIFGGRLRWSLGADESDAEVQGTWEGRVTYPKYISGTETTRAIVSIGGTGSDTRATAYYEDVGCLAQWDFLEASAGSTTFTERSIATETGRLTERACLQDGGKVRIAAPSNDTLRFEGFDALLGGRPTATGSLTRRHTSETDLTGTWRGQVDQDNSDPYSMELRIDASGTTGTVTYPELQCSGSIALIGTIGPVALFRETITDDARRTCAGQSTTIRIEAVAGGLDAHLAWRTGTADARLVRR